MLASCFILDFVLQSCLGFNKTHHLVPLTQPCPPGATTSKTEWQGTAVVSFYCSVAPLWPIEVCVSCLCPYLCDHGKSQDEEGDAAYQGEEWLVFPQVLRELVRHGGDDGLNGGKLELR